MDADSPAERSEGLARIDGPFVTLVFAALGLELCWIGSSIRKSTCADQ